MTESKIKEFRDDIKRTMNKNHEATLRTFVDFADYLSGFRMFNQAFDEYKCAREYAKKVLDPNPKKAQLLYEIDYGYLQVISEIDKARLPEALNEFMEKYPVMSEELDIIKRQDASHLIGYCNFEMKKYDEARRYLTLSFNLLAEIRSPLQPFNKDFKKKFEDNEIRLAQLYRTFVEIALAEKKYKEVKEKCEKAFQCQGIQKDVELYFYLLHVKRTYTPLKERLDISRQMNSLWAKNKKHKLKDVGLDMFYCLFQDYLVQKEYDNAEQQLWLAYKEKEAIKKDEENGVKKDLVEWYKLSERLQDSGGLEVDLQNDADASQRYEKMAHGFFKLKAFELAYNYYDKLLQATPNEDLLKKKSFLEAIIKCLNRFARSQAEYLKCFQHCDDLYEISKILQPPTLIDAKLDLAISMTKLDICSFEEKQEILNLVKVDLKDDKQWVKFYSAFISLLKDYLDKQSEEDITEMEEDLKLHQERIKAVGGSDAEPAALNPSDMYDEIKEAEVLQILKEKWQKYEKVEALKKKMNDKDGYGFNGFHKAIKKKNLAEIKFMIEECGYKNIMNEQDGGGRTPLFQAVMNGENEIAEYLIKAGAALDISTTDRGSKYPAGRTALMEASTLRNTAIIRLLLSNNANPLIKDLNGNLASDYLICEITIFEETVNDDEYSADEEEEFVDSEYSEMKETLKFMKNAEEEREKKDKENHREGLRGAVQSQNNRTSEACGSRKRTSSEMSNVLKRTRNY